MKRLIPILLTAVLAACTSESLKTTFAQQETWIENYVTSKKNANADARVETNGGSTRLVLVEGEGDELSPTGTVSFYYAGYVVKSASFENNSNLFATNREALASSWKLTSEDAFAVKTVDLASTDLVEGLKNGLPGVRGGEECVILFSGKHGFGKKLYGTIPANSAVAYHIWVESVQNE